MIREMNHRARRRVALGEEIKVRIEATHGATLWEKLYQANGPEYFGDPEADDAPDILTSWQSQETLGFFIRILASARKLRPVLEAAANEQQARDFYVDLHAGLRYNEHSYLPPGKSLTICLCMQWSDAEIVKRLTDSIDHWYRTLMLMQVAETPLPNADGNDAAFIPFSKAIELGSGNLTRKQLEKAISRGDPVKVRDRKPSPQRREVHIQDVLALIAKLKGNEQVAEQASALFGRYREEFQKKQPKPNLD